MKGKVLIHIKNINFMKKLSIIKIMAVLITATLLIGSCTKENEDVRLDPTLSTSQVANVTSNSATVYGFIVAEGSGFTEKGVVYSLQPVPTIDNNKVIYTGDKSVAAYPVQLTGLDHATKYYVRAYGITSAGIMYGEEFSFTTRPLPPTVVTGTVSDITGTTATVSGNVTDDGRAEVTDRGIVFSLKVLPTIDSSEVVKAGTGLGEFTANITGLKGLTKYYVRAYAVNSEGVTYGEQVEFTTEEIIILARTWYVPGDYVSASYPGSEYIDWMPDKSPQLKSNDAEPAKVEGYVYMANSTNQWKIATQPNWDGPNYGDGGEGQLTETGENIYSPAGYYKINVDATTLAYTAVPTVWGVIGDASPGDWADETALTYQPELRRWTGGIHMKEGHFKFRANHNWDYNYGGTGEFLEPGGADIPLDVEDDYYFALDLSNPLEYKYVAQRWGLIGSATPGGWNTDSNMSWDAGLHAMTITIDLIPGEVKFRANDDWGYNLGGAPDNLTQEGANIAIAEAGNYTITLYLTGDTGYCTIVKK